MVLLVLDAVLGVLLLTAIAFASRAPERRSDRARAIGWMLVAVPLPVAVALHAAGELAPATDQIMFVSGVVAFAVGSALLLGSRNDDDWGEAFDYTPPWWPEFERELREYENRAPSRPRTSTRV
jgi:hypothetical protein